jgi:hypothetical protein
MVYVYYDFALRGRRFSVVQKGVLGLGLNGALNLKTAP